MYSKSALLVRGHSRLYLHKVCRSSRSSSGSIKSLDNLLKHLSTASQRFDFRSPNEYPTDSSPDSNSNINGFDSRGRNPAGFHQNPNSQHLNPSEGFRGSHDYDWNPIAENRVFDGQKSGSLHHNPNGQNGSGAYSFNNEFSEQNPTMVHTQNSWGIKDGFYRGKTDMQTQTWGHNHSGHGQTHQSLSSFNLQAQSHYQGNLNWNETQNTAPSWGNQNVRNTEMNRWNWQNPGVGQYQRNFNYQNGMSASQVSTNPGAELDLAQASDSYGQDSKTSVTVEELDAFCKEGKLKEAVELLGLLVNKGSVIDLPRLLHLVQLCGEEEALQEAKSVHEHIIASVPHIEVSTYNKIIEMYSKCGSMDDASSVFNKMPGKNLATWATMIRWLAKNGLGEEAIDMFTRFKQEGKMPDGQIFSGVFSACAVLGDVSEGLLHFECMCKDYGIVPSMEHYVGLVDMFATTGYLDEALEFIEKMPMEPSVEVWETLMNLSRVHGNLDIGDRCAEIIEQLDASRLNEHSKAGLLPVNTSDFTKEKQKKMSGSQNPLEIRSRVHEYRAGDTSHPENRRIYALLRSLKSHMVEMGYIPETRFVLHDVDQESKEEALLSHSERLAFAHGLLTTSARSSIRVIKNLRVCVDCHNALKIISKIVGREFIMRDAKRFHHLKDGVCSCRDYW